MSGSPGIPVIDDSYLPIASEVSAVQGQPAPGLDCIHQPPALGQDGIAKFIGMVQATSWLIMSRTDGNGINA